MNTNRIRIRLTDRIIISRWQQACWLLFVDGKHVDTFATSMQARQFVRANY